MAASGDFLSILYTWYHFRDLAHLMGQSQQGYTDDRILLIIAARLH